MKRAIVFVLVLSMLFCLFGCSKSDKAETTSQDKAETTSQDKPLSIGSTLKLPFAEITFDKFYKIDKIMPRDTSGSYIGAMANEGKTFVVTEGIIKNTGKVVLAGTYLFATLDSGEKSYSVKVVIAADPTDTVTGQQKLSPSEECPIYFLVHIPVEEAADIHSGTLTLEFDENFGEERYGGEFDYTYKINVSE